MNENSEHQDDPRSHRPYPRYLRLAAIVVIGVSVGALLPIHFPTEGRTASVVQVILSDPQAREPYIVLEAATLEGMRYEGQRVDGITLHSSQIAAPYAIGCLTTEDGEVASFTWNGNSPLQQAIDAHADNAQATFCQSHTSATQDSAPQTFPFAAMGGQTNE